MDWIRNARLARLLGLTLAIGCAPESKESLPTSARGVQAKPAEPVSEDAADNPELPASPGSNASTSIDGAKPPELVVQVGHTSPVNTVSFSPDGNLLASGSGATFSFVEVNVVKLWEVATGTELRTLVHSEPVKWIGFSPDGSKVAARGESGIGPGKTQVWNIATGAECKGDLGGDDYVSSAASPSGGVTATIDGKKIHLRDANGMPLRSLLSRTSDFQKTIFSPDSSTLASGGERFSIRLWDLQSGVLRTLEGHTDYPVVADFSPDSRLFASGGRDLSVRLWDVASGQPIKRLDGHTAAPVRGMHFSPNGKTLLSFDRAGFKLWDVASGKELVSAAGNHDDDFSRVVFHPSGELLAAATDQGITLWETDTGGPLRTLPAALGALAFSPDGEMLLCDQMMRIDLWNVASGKPIATMLPSEKGETEWDVKFERVVFSPDSRTLAVSEFDSRESAWLWRLYLHDAKTGKQLHRIERDAKAKTMDPSGQLIFSPDSRKIMNVGHGDDLTWDVATGKGVPNFERDDQYFDSPDHAYRVAIGSNGELQLFDGRDGRELISLIGIDERDWLVVTAEGFFDGSPEAWKQIYWRFNNDTFNHVPLESFFNEFYYPALLPDVLAGKRPTAPRGKQLAQIDRRQPTLSIANAGGSRSGENNTDYSERTITLAIEITEDAGLRAQATHPATSGARDVRLFRNGSLVKAWRGDVFALGASDGCQQLPADSQGKGRRARCEVNVPILAGANDFSAYAFNHANVKSADAALTIRGDESLRRDATLHVLAIGVNVHENERFNLRYAVADAEAFSREVQRQQELLGNFAKFDVRLLTNSEATKANVLAAIAALAQQAQPEDSVIVYFAGHGTAEQNQFYLVPHDLGPAGGAQSEEGMAPLLRRCISDRELERAFERVEAANFLFVIDACHSGQALESEEKRRGPMNSKGLAQLAYEKGMYVLAAAQSFQAALEAAKLGHGLLTYVLVDEGLQHGAADAQPRDNRILLREWLDFATHRVPEVRIQATKLASDRGLDLRFTEDQQAATVVKRAGQRPRVFYRRETERKPLVIAQPRSAN